MKLNKKSQIIVTDLMVAMFIFTVLLTAIMVVWNRHVVTANKQAEYEEAQIMVYQVSDLLVKTKGDPADWEEKVGNVTLTPIIGLASSDRIISEAKVNAFLNINYNTSKKFLKIPYYGFSFQINDLQGNNLTSFYGSTPSGDFIISLRRYVLYKNEKAIMEFKLWK